MIPGIVVLLIALVVAALRDWRVGVLSSIVVGFAADPLRKLIPGQPVAMVIAVGVVFGAAVFSFLKQHGMRAVQGLKLWRSASEPLQLFVLWIVFSSALGLFRFHNPILAGIGLMSYFAPIPALVLAFYYGRNLQRARKLLLVYLILNGIMQAGVYLSFLGFQWPILKQVGEGMLIYAPGVVLEAHCGLFRSPEIAAWHTGTAIALLIMLVNAKWVRLSYPVAVTLILFFLGAGLLTGRRKFFAVIVLFLCTYYFMLNRSRQGARNVLSLALMSAAIGTFAVVALVAPSQFGSQLDPYLQRTGTVFGEAGERMKFLGIQSIGWAFAQFGVLGGGAGIASQGGQHFGRVDEIAGAAEGGLGKITVELGVPGLLLAIWIAVAVARFVRRLLHRATAQRAVYNRMIFGLFAFLAANVPAFFVASQAFGDPFVLVTIGLLFGFLLAIAEVAAHVEKRPLVGSLVGNPRYRSLGRHALVPRHPRAATDAAG